MKRALVLALFLVACGSEDGPPEDAGTQFVAFTSSFAGFRTWTSFHIDDPGEQATPGQGVVHVAGPRTEYINQTPPAGAKEFPVGTIIVKEIEVGAMEDRKVFAMVKRGGGYNAAGAVGWEWFELQNDADGSLKRMVWRGLGPPAGEQYGGDPTGCSGCHAVAKDNDYVRSSAIHP